MNVHTQWMSAMVDTTRRTVETGMQTMDRFSQTAVKIINQTMSNAQMMQKETNDAVNSWMDHADSLYKVYKDTVHQGLRELEQYLTPAGSLKNK